MNLLFTFIVVLIIIFIGYIAKRINLLKFDDVEILNKIVIYIAMPALVFYSLYNADLSLIPKIGILPFVNIIIVLICALIVYLILSYLKIDTKKKWSIVLVSSMANTGFFGFPIILGIYGNNGLIRAIFYDIGTTVIFIIFNIILILKYNGEFKELIKKILTFPILWAVIFGFCLNYLNIYLGYICLTSLEYLKNLTIPLIMLSLGLSIDFKGFKENINVVLFTSFIKLILSPLILLLIFNIINLGTLEETIAICEAAMPPAMLSLVIALNYGLDSKIASDCIFIDMMISLITLPIIMSII